MAAVSSSAKNQKKKKVTVRKNPTTNSPASTHRKARRQKSPGVRFVHNRIYDSQNGRTCHQCRQKTLDFSAKCQGKTGNKQCTFYFCHKCLFNRSLTLTLSSLSLSLVLIQVRFRYGEKAEEVTELVDWLCPKCRGICNCSFCMKKRGQLPTGILAHTAKAQGFASVSDMLHRSSSVDKHSGVGAPTGDQKDADEEEAGPVLARRGSKRNTSKGPGDSMELQSKESGGRKKVKRSRISVKEGSACGDYMQDAGHRTFQILHEESAERGTLQREDGGSQMNPEIKFHSRGSNSIHSNRIEAELGNEDAAGESRYHKKKDTFKTKRPVSNVKTLLPEGILLESVATIDFPTEDVGHALQFLEFCEAFGEVLNLRKGHTKKLLKELADGKQKSRTRNSSIVRIHIQLLSVIQSEYENVYTSLSQNINETSWFKILREYISESEYPLEQLLLDRHLDVQGYHDLNSSQKLRIINFLCDEALSTPDFRKLIEEQNLIFVERRKKAKLDQKEKVTNLGKEVKKKLQDEAAKAVLMKSGAPLSIAEHDALVSRIKLEVAQTLDVASTLVNTLGSSDPVLEEMQSDAVRCEPIFSEGNSHKFWRLKGYSGNIDILLQAIEKSESSKCEERWYTYEAEHRAAVEDYVSSPR